MHAISGKHEHYNRSRCNHAPNHLVALTPQYRLEAAFPSTWNISAYPAENPLPLRWPGPCPWSDGGGKNKRDHGRRSVSAILIGTMCKFRIGYTAT